ncbi:hypothetical protein ACNIUX_06535, partial [Escherichia coli]
SLKTSIKTITYLSDTGCLEIQGASLSSFKIFADAGYLGPDKLLPLIRRYRLVDLSDTARELLLENEKIRTSLDKARMYTILAPVAAMFISAVFLYVQ